MILGSVLTGSDGLTIRAKGTPASQRDRGKIPDRIVSQLEVQCLVDGQCGRGRQQQCVAIRRSPCYLLRAERGRDPRLVLDDDGRAKAYPELFGDQAAEKSVVPPAG